MRRMMTFIARDTRRSSSTATPARGGRISSAAASNTAAELSVAGEAFSAACFAGFDVLMEGSNLIEELRAGAFLLVFSFAAVWDPALRTGRGPEVALDLAVAASVREVASGRSFRWPA